MAVLTDTESCSKGWWWRMRRQLPVFFFCMIFFAGMRVQAQTAAPKEYALKAVFLYNFTQFVEWPSDAFAHADSPLVIGVLGEDPFGSFLDETVRGETVHDRPLAVRRYSRIEEIETCHILFICHSEAEHVDQIVSSLSKTNTLTVSDQDGFTKSGVMIRFANEKNKIRLKINVEATKASRLTISSKLLRLADITTKGKE